MKKQLTILAECGSVVILDAAQSTSSRYLVPPFASFFETVWKVLQKDFSHVCENESAEVVMYYNCMEYHWNHAAARRCFVERRIDEKELADVILVTSKF